MVRPQRFFDSRAFHQRGWFYHWLDAKTGERRWNSEVSSIDTALLLAGLVLLRAFPFVWWTGTHFDSDQAVVGLMAKHISEGRAWPLYFYGQNYMLAVEAYLAAPVMWVIGVSVLALFVLRQREPNAPRPFRAWGYPIAPAVFAIASLAIVLNALWADLGIPILKGTPWGPSAAGLIVIGLGVPLYFFFSRRR